MYIHFLGTLRNRLFLRSKQYKVKSLKFAIIHCDTCIDCHPFWACMHLFKFIQMCWQLLMSGLAFHLALGLAYHMILSVPSMSPFAISWLSIWRRTIMCLLSQYQYWNSKQSAVEFIFHISSDCLTFWLTCDLRSVSSAYVHRCMTRRVHPFLFLHVGVVLFPNICERFHGHGSRFIWILQPRYSSAHSLLCI